MLLTGTDEEGNNTSLPPYVTLGAVRWLVQWLDAAAIWAASERGDFDGGFSALDDEGEITETTRIPVRIPTLMTTEGSC